jgi:hypothetical protein
MATAANARRDDREKFFLPPVASHTTNPMETIYGLNYEIQCRGDVDLTVRKDVLDRVAKHHGLAYKITRQVPKHVIVLGFSISETGRVDFCDELEREVGKLGRALKPM